MRDTTLGIRGLSAFFLFGACASGLSVVKLAFPGGKLDVLWRVNAFVRGDWRTLMGSRLAVS
jgi:hypothetical protein